MSAIPYDSQLTVDVTGRLTVSEDLLERKLGEPAFLLWQILCFHRDRRGLTTITYAGIQRTKQFSRLTPKQIKTGLRRLNKAGLVVDLGKRRRRMMRPSRKHDGQKVEVWAMPRLVLGARAVSFQGNVALVPNLTWRWVQGNVGWGGWRKGAGRKKNQVVPIPPLSEFNQVGPPIYNLLSGPVDQNQIGVFCPASQDRKHGPRSGPVLFSLKRPDSPPANVDLGTRIGGATRQMLPPSPGKNGVPPFPTATRIPPAMVPRPPRLPDDIDDLEAVRWLLKAYCGAMESRYKKRCWVLARRGELERSRYLPKLVEATKELRELDIPPAAWAAFSVDCWRKYSIGKGKPRFTWVYSTKRVEEQLDWFRREEGHYAARRAIFPEAAQDLMRRYQQMQYELARTGAQGRREVEVVVQKWFPDGLYDRLVEKARARALDDQVRINRRVASGEWVWG